MQYVFPVLDRLVQDLGDRHIDLEFGVPKSVFFPCFTIGRVRGSLSQLRISDCKSALYGPCTGHHYPRQRIWRPVPIVPGLPAGIPEDSEGYEIESTGFANQGKGYWISGTAWDLPPAFWTDSSYHNLRDGHNRIDEFERAWYSPAGWPHNESLLGVMPSQSCF